jgi:acetate kinase
VSAGGDAIVVLNAGSSSIKFCTFRLAGGALERELRGQVSGVPWATRP